MLRIGEFAKLGQVSIRTLRHYDDKKLLQPMTIDSVSGYRYYSIRQLDTLRQILVLKELNFSLRDIKEILVLEDMEIYKERLQQKKQEIQEELNSFQQKTQLIDQVVQQLAEPAMQCDVALVSIPSYPVVSLRKMIRTYYHEGELWQEFYQLLQQEKLLFDTTLPNNCSIFHDEGYREEGIDIEIALKVKELTTVSPPLRCWHTPAIPLAASLMVYGPYYRLVDGYYSFAAWLDQHPQYEMNKISRQVCHIGEGETDNPEEYVTELQFQLIET